MEKIIREKRTVRPSKVRPPTLSVRFGSGFGASWIQQALSVECSCWLFYGWDYHIGLLLRVFWIGLYTLYFGKCSRTVNCLDILKSNDEDSANWADEQLTFLLGISTKTSGIFLLFLLGFSCASSSGETCIFPAELCSARCALGRLGPSPTSLVSPRGFSGPFSLSALSAMSRSSFAGIKFVVSCKLFATATRVLDRCVRTFESSTATHG